MTKIFGHRRAKIFGQLVKVLIIIIIIIPCVTDRVDSRVLLKGRTKNLIMDSASILLKNKSGSGYNKVTSMFAVAVGISSKL